ncbi:MAG: DUF3883 domain-containing protein, partial [Propionibacteriaceae bacterium]|nr:DUF3883 domain-containing protein [Propionibacteriaceae bacterium]
VNLSALPAHIRGQALVIPSRQIVPDDRKAAAAYETKETEAVERRAVDLVLTAERTLGRTPVEMDHWNPGYDIRSTDPDGRVYFIEVKGRIQGATTFCITANEVAVAQTQGDRHRLALVAVDPDDPAKDEVRYVTTTFAHLDPMSPTRSANEDWHAYWSRGGDPR